MEESIRDLSAAVIFYQVVWLYFEDALPDNLIRARIDSAKNALLFTSATNGEIAEDLGYNNLPHFMRQFKAMDGMTPNGYRKIKDHLPER